VFFFEEKRGGLIGQDCLPLHEALRRLIYMSGHLNRNYGGGETYRIVLG